MYAIAAGAAGVLALAGPAEAKIIYTQTHVVIGTNPPPTLVWTRDKRLPEGCRSTWHSCQPGMRDPVSGRFLGPFLSQERGARSAGASEERT